MQKEDEYLELLRAFLVIVEASKGTPAGEDDRVLDAEGLALKCYSHACSFLYLLRGTNVPELRVSFFDTGSINVIGRAILESFLVFHYIFIDSKNDEEQTFRYLCWLYHDLVERQGFPARSPQGKEKLKSEEKVIKQISTKIEASPCFEMLSTKQKRNLLNGKYWRSKGWKSIALSAGLSEVHADDFYAYLCSYAAYMAKGYCAYFPKSNDLLQASERHKKIIQVWTEIGASNLDDVDIDWKKVNV
jgi:hypothetical protein